MKRIFLWTLLGLGFADAALAATYAIDSNHTQVVFTYNHLGFSNITGRLDQVTGTLDFDATTPANSKIEVQIPLASLSTGVSKLDEHLRGPEFFDAGKFPTASFKSTKVIATEKDKLKVLGALTIHGITKPVTLDVSINRIGMHPMKKVPAVGFDASTTIKRSDFGIAAYVPMVSDTIKLSITMEAQTVVNKI